MASEENVVWPNRFSTIKRSNETPMCYLCLIFKHFQIWSLCLRAIDSAIDFIQILFNCFFILNCQESLTLPNCVIKLNITILTLHGYGFQQKYIRPIGHLTFKLVFTFTKLLRSHKLPVRLKCSKNDGGNRLK